ncbi:GNAT family N-acetyltransferase [Hymenobacter busanensis]|uniref:GNAT family N-acetyltransferase n=1 Tax=Hymenobacter busanensis TaxID=2607656 RepID=A0A7L4ZUF6_9BACT|nr:GNAT family N-acetyltransferase [Hymenobacter busanensis]KAA9339692.1 GNAT family N-acetyltransferase [Hymenobacter busanensis]QHJ06553.1 GNAT family N-acetyltransferase [Hymenobacter busanensis]
MPFSAETLTSRTVLECSAAEQAEAMNRSFEQYLVPMQFDVTSFQRRFRGENLDAAASRLWYCGEELVGVVYIARRGWTSRVAAMGLVLEARGRGLGRPMLQTAIDEAAARGDRLLMLEVFTDNVPAIRLYERLGFRTTRRLVGFQRNASPQPGPLVETLTHCDPLEVARQVAREGDAALPWMLAAETLAATVPPFVEAWQLAENAYALVRPEPDRVMVLGLVVPRAVRRQGWGRRLVRALESQYAGRRLTAHSLLPKSAVSELLQHCGWEPQALELYEMERPL